MRVLLAAFLVLGSTSTTMACDVDKRASALMTEIRSGPMALRKATGGVTGDTYAQIVSIKTRHGAVHGHDRTKEAALSRELAEIERRVAAQRN